jgi:hypothetical protein
MAHFEDEVTENKIQKEIMSTAIWGANNNTLPGHTLGRRDDKNECTHIEFVIKASDINKHPGLLNCIKLAMSHQSKGMNKHVDCMARLNGISELTQIIKDHIKNVKKRPLSSADNNDQKGKEAKKHRVAHSKSVSIGEPLSNNVSVGETLTLTAPSSNEEDSIFSGMTEDTNGAVWGRGSYRILVGNPKISYRVFKTKIQCQGTELPKGCFGFFDPSSFDPILSSGNVGLRIPTTNLIHSVLSALDSAVPRVVSSLRARRGGKKKNASKSNCYFHSDSVEEKMIVRVSCAFIPEATIGMDGCHVQNMIAELLGGVRSLSKAGDNMHSYWYFPSKGLALDHLALCVLCVMGETSYYKKLRSDVLKQDSKSLPKNTDEKVAVSGYRMENLEKLRESVVGYFLLANNESAENSKTKDQPGLVLAIPSRKHACLRASGVPLTKKMLGKDNVTRFFRLL